MPCLIFVYFMFFVAMDLMYIQHYFVASFLVCTSFENPLLSLLS